MRERSPEVLEVGPGCRLSAPRRRVTLLPPASDGERKAVAAVVLKLVTAHTSLDKTRSLSRVTRGMGT